MWGALHCRPTEQCGVVLRPSWFCVMMPGMEHTTTAGGTTTTQNNEGLLIAVTIEGAASLLSVAPAAVHDLIAERRLPVVRVGGELLVSVEQLRSLMPPVILRAPEVATRLGCHPKQVYEMWASGELPCVRVRRSKHMTEQQLASWEARGGSEAAVRIERETPRVPEWVVEVERREAEAQVRTALEVA